MLVVTPSHQYLCCEIFGLQGKFVVMKTMYGGLLKQEPTHCKVHSKSHPTSTRLLSKVGPTYSIHVKLPEIGFSFLLDD